MFDTLLPDNGEKSLYLRLYQYFRNLIEEGALRNGDKLPSVRAVQQQLSVSKTTVEAAYQLLLAEGYIFSKPKSGYYVVRPSGSEMPAQSQLRTEEQRTGYAASRSAELPESRLIDFNLLDVDRETFPAKAWRSALTEAVDRYGATLHQYGDPMGEYDLRRCIAQYLKTSRGVICAPEQVLVGTGIAYSLFVLGKLFGTAGRVAFERSSIAQVGGIFAQHGFTPIPSLGGGDPGALDSVDADGLQAIYVTPSHRPYGQPLTNEMKERLIRWSSQRGVFILEDDYDGEFRYRGRPVPSLQGADRHQVVIYMGTFSKSFTPAIRMNYLVLPECLLPRLESFKYALSCPSRIDQLAMGVFMEKGHWYRHLKRTRKKYRTKLDVLVKLLERELHGIGEVKTEGTGLYVEVAVTTGRSQEELIQAAIRHGVRVYGKQFADSGAETGIVRLYLGFGGIDLEDMERGVMQLKKAWV